MLVGFTYSDASRWSNGPSPHLIIVGSLIQTDLGIGTLHCACRIHGSHLGKATIFAPSEEFSTLPNHPLSLFAPLRGQIRRLRTLSQLGRRAWWDHCLGSACTPDYQGSAGLVCFQLWPQGGVQAIQTLAPSSCLLVTSPCTDKYS